MNKGSIVEAVLQRLIALGRVTKNRYINYLLYFFYFMPHLLILTVSQVVFKQKFLEVGCPSCHQNNSINFAKYRVGINFGWQRGVVVSVLALINVVNQHWARLLLGRVTACGQVNCLGM